ncbi:MAG: phosphodiesterase, partial [Acidobacteria bacterium]
MSKSLSPIFILISIILLAFGFTANAATDAHVLLISVDGLHQSDVGWYVKNYPQSTIATIVKRGIQYTNALTPFPSDSFPGLIAQVTGGNPLSTGIFYDASHNRALLVPGTSQCAGVKKGTDVLYDESIDKNTDRLDAGQGIYKPSDPESILKMTGDPATLIDQTLLPVDPKKCQPVFPHSY